MGVKCETVAVLWIAVQEPFKRGGRVWRCVLGLEYHLGQGSGLVGVTMPHHSKYVFIL
jgi:hypothetical protein